jgi:hypothetical protein
MTEYAKDFGRKAQAADADYFEYEKAQGLPFDQLEAIRNEARSMWRDYGVTDQQLALEWNTNLALRSAGVQRAMFDLAKFRLTARSLASKAVRPGIPVVQRPGSPVERARDSDVQIDRLNAKLDRTGSARDAANLLIAQRRARG